jgi:hypothetical protein
MGVPGVAITSDPERHRAEAVISEPTEHGSILVPIGTVRAPRTYYRAFYPAR